MTFASIVKVALAWVLAIGLVRPAFAETIAELHEKARAEGALVFFAGGPAEPHERRAKQFQERFPGVAISVTGGFSNVLNETINKQMAAGRLEVDMAFFQTVQDFVAWKSRGALLHFKPDGFDQVLPNLRDEDGAYVTLSANVLSYAYNTRHVKPQDAPRSALDFLKPMFMGKAISVYPADDDAALYLFHLIVKKYGWDWMDKYTANKPSYIQGHLPVARSVASGESWVTLDASSSVWPMKRAGQVEVVYSEIDESPVFTLTGGIFKNAPHPNAAKLYLTWFLATEQQARNGSYSARADVPPPEGFKPLTSLKIANAYREFMLDEKSVQELRARFERYTGPPVNKGGVR